MLQLADSSVKKSIGEIEDVLIKIGEFIFLVDFMALEIQLVMNPQYHIPIILGGSFLPTSNVVNNYQNWSMRLSFRNIILNLNKFNIGCQPINLLDKFLNVNAIQSLSSKY